MDFMWQKSSDSTDGRDEGEDAGTTEVDDGGECRNVVLESPVDDDTDEFVGAVYDRKPYIGQVLEVDDESMYANFMAPHVKESSVS